MCSTLIECYSKYLGVFIESESRGVALKEKPLKNRFGGRVAVVGGLVSGTPKAETRLSEE